jgi:hypothetical protein
MAKPFQLARIPSKLRAKLEREQVRFLGRDRKTNGPVRKVLPMKLKR